MLKCFLFIVIICLTAPLVSGQDSIPVKSYPVDTPATKHSPRAATIMSAVLPGLGQAYNKKYWKIPVIYAGIGVSIYYLYLNTTEYNRYRTAYIYRTDSLALPKDEFDGLYSEAQIKSGIEYYQRYRDLSVIALVAMYAINIVDATVDAHLFNYDVSEKVSLNIKPYIYTPVYSYSNQSNNNIYGLRCYINLK